MNHSANEEQSLIRLQKFLSEAGICSRRAAEQLIVEGRVAVNGRRTTTLGTKVSPVEDRVTVVCTRKDPQGRPTVLDFLPPEMQHVYPVGRLDYDSEGLILLTSDGELCNHITHPSSGVDKVYYVEVQGAIKKETISKMLKGIYHEGDFLRASAVKILRTNNTRTCLTITLREGKNREIRRILDSLDQIVLVLRRVQVGSVKLDKLALGKWRLLTKTEIQFLLNA